MTHEELNCAKIHPAFKKMGSEGVTQHVDASLLGDSRLLRGVLFYE